MDYIIKRPERGNIQDEQSWLLVYGRRKTGKTFLLKELCAFDRYYLVKRDLSILSGTDSLNPGEAVKRIREELAEGKQVVLDEFQRLPEGILEELLVEHPKGRLILSGSSMRIQKTFFSSKSPFLGFFTPRRIGFIDPVTMMRSLKQKFQPALTIELSAFLREPWLVPLYRAGESIEAFVFRASAHSAHIIPALIGEIFTEEERELSTKFEALVSLIGSGEWDAKRLANILHSRNIIPEPSQSSIAQYLKNLREMDIAEAVRPYRSKKLYHRLRSPIASVFYGLDRSYDIRHRSVSYEEARPTVRKLIHLEVQNFVADLFAELQDGRKEYCISPSREIDFIITKRNKPQVVGEVKWKTVTQKDVDHFREQASFLPGRKILVCRDGFIGDPEIEVIDAGRLVKLACGKDTG